MIKLEDFQILMIINSGQQNRIRTGEYSRGHTLSVKNYECVNLGLQVGMVIKQVRDPALFFDPAKK